MPDQRIKFKNFGAGLNDDDIVPPPSSPNVAADMIGVNFRNSPGRLSLLQQAAKESGSVITGDMFDAVRVSSGDVYILNSSKLYKRAAGSDGANGTYSVADSSLGAATDLDYRSEFDSIFIYDYYAIHQYQNVSGTPVMQGGKFSAYVSIDQSANVGGTYTLPTVLTEADRFTFTCSKEPLNTVGFWIDTKSGTPTFTMEVHDVNDNVLATLTLTSADIPSISGTPFSFANNNSSPICRMAIGNDYHIHIYSSVAGNKIKSKSTNTLQDAELQIWASRLVPWVNFSPAYYGQNPHLYGYRTIKYGAKTYICNERYLAEWEILDLTDNATGGYDAHKLVFPSNYISCGLAPYSEYLAIACAIRNNSDSIGDGYGAYVASGAIFLWDATSSTFNVVIDVPQGVPNSLFAYADSLWFEAAGTLYKYSGNGLEPIFQFPGVDNFLGAGGSAPSVDHYLSAPRIGMAIWKGLLLIAFPSRTANTNVPYAIYSYGQNRAAAPLAMGKDYLISTGTTTVQFDTSTNPYTPFTSIEMLKVFGSNMFIFWKDIVGGVKTYGVDMLNDRSPKVATASWRSMWRDNAAPNYYRTLGLDEGDPDIEKTPKALKVTFEKLATGCTVTPFVQYDHSGVDITGTNPDNSIIQGVAGDVDVVLPLDSSNGFYSVQCGVNLSSANGNDIKVLSLVLKYADNTENTLATETHKNAS